MKSFKGNKQRTAGATVQKCAAQ